MPPEENYQTQPVEVISEEILPYEPIEEAIEEPQEAIPEPPVYDVAEFYVSNDFYNRVNIFRLDNIVAYMLLLLSSRRLIAITSDYINYLGVSNDDATKISYLDRNKIERRLREGIGFYEDPATRYHASAAKTIRKVLSCLHMKDIMKYEYVFSDLKAYYTNKNLEVPSDLEQKNTLLDLVLERDIDDFNNRFRLEGFKQLDGVAVQVVKGHLIKEFYNEKNYSSSSGTLGNSCMRYSNCQSYLNIYAENPSICSLAVIVDSKGKLQARALLWNIEDTIYFDRIYSTSDIVSDRMRSDFLTKGYLDCYRTNRYLVIQSHYDSTDLNKTVNLKFNEYPYMDTFKFLQPDHSMLSTQEWPDEEYYVLNETDGTFKLEGNSREEDLITCTCCNREVHVDESCYVDLVEDDNYDQSLCNDCATYSSYHGTYISDSESVYISNQGPVHESVAIHTRCGRDELLENCVELTDGTYCLIDDAERTEEGSYVILGEPGFEEWIMCQDNEIRLFENCVETKDGEYVLRDLSEEYEGEIWEKNKLEVYLANLNII